MKKIFFTSKMIIMGGGESKSLWMIVYNDCLFSHSFITEHHLFFFFFFKFIYLKFSKLVCNISFTGSFFVGINSYSLWRTLHLTVKSNRGESKSFAIFWYMLVYSTWPKQLKLQKLPAEFDSIVVVSVLTCCALVHYVWCESWTDKCIM